jgi:hypothetical protein
MHIAPVVRKNVFLKLPINLFRGLSLFRNRQIKNLFYLVWDWSPYFLLTDTCPIVNEVIDHLMAECAHGFPILRV